jgi:hypothetical protein
MHTFSDVFGHFWCCFAPFCHPAVLCVLLLAQSTGSAVFPLQDAAGQTRPVLADASSSQRPVPVAETKIPEPLPEFDPDNPLAIGIILAFHRWPDEDEQRIILERRGKRDSRRRKRSPVSKSGFLNGMNGERRQRLRRSAAACRTFPLWSTVSPIIYLALMLRRYEGRAMEIAPLKTNYDYSRRSRT